ncbi:Transglutaminase-like enzyme, putative cysteine protease [Tessaracoccus bendigoensis DSM 12906]|uniref:Transglutaminase-like enzyme, putative cysteine protease n=1 Tax=Tessaracoccus bendigoensis DSM 12906 TaxID=1123357 RepID=A0A1M6AZ68_9ACTN|nr:transglutaminase family protein [Tessaracoccus bendigoensis]SHI41608.1 Transglutaminase-like enzyme, putative cysteine protease [Tessaracoccus bendigoensis DSM 12906]
MRQRQENLTARRYFVRHKTEYTYPSAVTRSHQRGVLAPRDTGSQRVVAHAVAIEPAPLLLTRHIDIFGNHSQYFEIHFPHTRFSVVKESVIDVEWPPVDVESLDRWSLSSAQRVIADNPALRMERAVFGLPSHHVVPTAEVMDYADTIIAAELGFGQALGELTRGIWRDFDYRPGVTSTRTTVDEVLALRAGVCQDFAHVGIAVLRGLGIPARYVSGYLETVAPAGREKLEGSDASHAWISVLAPNGAWIDIDPTNGQFADSRYLVTAWGRDFADVSPLRGLVETEAPTSELSVGVDVIPMEGESLPEASRLRLQWADPLT